VRVTVVELPDDERELPGAWDALCTHTAATSPDLVLLHEVPFAEWFGASPRFDPVVWQHGVDAHERWRERLGELHTGAVIYTAPTGSDERRNTALRWTPDTLDRLRDKALLPDEDPCWEASWYGPGSHAPTTFGIGAARAAVLICSELWALEWSAELGRRGVHLLLTPRATEDSSLETWFAAGRVAAIAAGAYSLSSNRVGAGFGGGGWVFGPDGDLLARTSADQPFVTVELDLRAAEAANSTYPRYVIRDVPTHAGTLTDRRGDREVP
jgi:N-carbamoylputrescine amidase